MKLVFLGLCVSAAAGTRAWARGRQDEAVNAARAANNRGAAASAAEIPALANLLAKAGWTPTPELSGVFKAGSIFEVAGVSHNLLSSSCFSSVPEESTYTAAELVTSLQAGVSVGGPLAGGGAYAGIVKKVKFGTPTQISIPGLELELSTSCEEKLRSLPIDRIQTTYVVREVLKAEISEQTCGKVDARGSFVGLGSAEAEYAAACAQSSLEPVAVGYRIVPLAELLHLNITESGRVKSGRASGESSASGGGFDPSGTLAQIKAAKDLETRLNAELDACLDKEERKLVEQAKADASALAPLLKETSAKSKELGAPEVKRYINLYGEAEVKCTNDLGERRRPVRVSSVALMRSWLVTPAKNNSADTTAVHSNSSPSADTRKVLRMTDIKLSREDSRERRHEAMNYLKNRLDHPDTQGTQKAEIMLRLAELYIEEGRDIRLDEAARYQAAYDKCVNADGCDPTRTTADYTQSRMWSDKAIRIFQKILESYPQYQRADEATFYLASALQETGQKEAAAEQFTALVRTYPESAYVPDAYVNIGEFYYARGDPYKALMAYQKAARYKDSPQYAFATYKLAWCFYDVGEFGKAIDTMKSVVQFSMTQDAAAGDAGQKRRLSLPDEALEDLVRFFTDAGEMDEAYVYFTKLGKKDLIKDILIRLAATYFEQGKFDRCILNYRYLIAGNPQGKDAPMYQNSIIEAYTKIGRREETLSEIERLRTTYGKSSAWARDNSADHEAVKSATDYVEKNLRTAATNFHNDAKKMGTGKGAIENYALAYKAYSVYLQEFPEGKYTYDVRYAFGQLLYRIKKFDEAWDQCMKVVALDPNGQHSKFCADSAVYAAVEVEKGAAKSGDSAAVALWKQRQAEACATSISLGGQACHTAPEKAPYGASDNK